MKQRLKHQDWAAIKNPTVADLIERHIHESTLPGSRPFGKSKTYTARLVQARSIGKIVASALKPYDFVEHCRARRADGIAAATVKHDSDYLKQVIETAEELWEVQGVSIAAYKKAKRTLLSDGLIGKSKPRDRRPTPDEMARITEGARERMKWRTTKIPLPVIFEFSYTIGRRISETCRLTWGDINAEKRTCVVRDLKNSKGKGFHGVFPLLGRSWDIVMCQPRRTDDPDERVFPYNPQSCGAAFRAVCKKLGIENLRLHDQRRECFSGLFEQGYSVPEVQKVSMHRNATVLLSTYTSLNPEDMHKGPASKRQSA